VNGWISNRIAVFAGLVVLAAWMSCVAQLRAAGTAGDSWRIGASFEQALLQPAGVLWSDTPLRQALTNLGAAQRVAVLIDRRVDPGQELTLAVQDTSLRQIFELVAERQGLGVTFLGSLVYLGPPQYTARLRTLAELHREESRKLPTSSQRLFSLPRTFGWSDFDAPREILDRLSESSGVEIVGLEQVPHDLWAQADLPGMALTDILTVILGQFELTFKFASEGTGVMVVPLPDNVALVRSYPGGRQVQRLAQRWAASFPEAEIKVQGSTIWVRALLEIHEEMAGHERPAVPSEPRSTDLERRYTLDLKDQPVGPVLEQLCRQLGLRLVLDSRAIEQAGLSLDKRVTVSVTEVSAEELFRQIAGAAGFVARCADETVAVKPAE
jgi:hypothetical protein